MPIELGPIIYSNLNRTKHTAALIAVTIAKARGIKPLEIKKDSRIRPLDTGDFTGLPKDEYSIEQYLKHPDWKIPSGESVNEFEDRQKDFAKDELEKSPEKKPIIVGHLSTVVFWFNQDEAKPAHYSNERQDLVHPGGIIGVFPDGSVEFLHGANPKALEELQEDDKEELE